MTEECSVWDILNEIKMDGNEDLHHDESECQKEIQHISAQLWQHSQGLSKLQSIPSSYFIVPSGSQVTLPLIRWTFRGFSIVMWIYIPREQNNKKIRLFKFYSTSKIQGIECWITPQSDERMTLSVASVTDDKGWRHVSSQFQWTPDKWHFVVISHRQHYLKKSHVLAHINGIRVMNEDLSFPTLMGPMSQCLIGGSDANISAGEFSFSGFTMYEDEIPFDVISTLHRFGPSHTCIRRVFCGTNPFQHSLLSTDGLCPLMTVDKTLLFTQHVQVKIVLSFTAQDVFTEDSKQPLLCIQWSPEGDVDGYWTRMKMDAESVIVHEMHVMLDSEICLKKVPNRSDEWFRYGGILSIPVLLSSVLKYNSATLVTDALHLMRGLLRNSIAHQEEMLHGYGFHLVSHVLCTKEMNMECILTPSIATTCVELVLDLWISENKINTMPLFAAGIHGLLLDFNLWSRAPLKTQSILIQQILLFVSTNPQALHQAIQVQHVVDILRCYYMKKIIEDDTHWFEECVNSLVLLVHQALFVAVDDSRDVLTLGNTTTIKFSLRFVQDMRILSRFLLVCSDPLIATCILKNLCENCDSDTIKFTYVASNMMELLLYLMGPKHGWSVRLMAVRLFVILFEWISLDDTKSLLHAVEKTYHMDVVADPRLLNELGYDTMTCMGLQHSVVVNDMTNRSNENPLSDNAMPVLTPTKKDPTSNTSKDWKPPSWWKLHTGSNRLVLTFSDRRLVVRAIALRQAKSTASTGSIDMQQAFTANLAWFLALPIRGILPFTAAWFPNLSISDKDREKFLMEVSVVVKTNKDTQTQLLDEPWVPWLGDLLLSCPVASAGEDLVIDTIITMMGRALYHSQGWLRIDELFLKFPSLGWRRRVLGHVFVRTARTKAMLSRSMGENLYRLLMLATYLLIQDTEDHFEFLLSAALDVTEMLLESTHKKHRAGIVPGIRLCRLFLAQVPQSLADRMIQLIENALQQEVGQRMPIDESIPTAEMLLRVLRSIAQAIQMNPELHCNELALRIATSGLFEREELSISKLSTMETSNAALYALSILVDEPECLDGDEIVDWALWMPKWFPMAYTISSSAEKPCVIDAASQVEEKRVWEVLKDIAKKEQERMNTYDGGIRQRLLWTDVVWKNLKHKINSEKNWKNLFQLNDLQEYQLTQHEISYPKRQRYRFDVYFSSHLTTSISSSISTIDLDQIGRTIAKKGILLNKKDSNIFELYDEIEKINENQIDDEIDEKIFLSYFSYLNPSSGRSIEINDREYFQGITRKIIPEGLVLGIFSICDDGIIYQPNLNHSIDINLDMAFGLQKSYRWLWKDIVSVYTRRFRLRESAIEIFLQNGTSHFFDFHGDETIENATKIRNDVLRLIHGMCPHAYVSISRLLEKLTKEWQMHLITNYDYLMGLNTLAGRSFNDITQYPIFPWILSNYTSNSIDLNDPKNYRPLNQPMGALNPNRLSEYWERYHSFDDPVIPKFLYGSHYSTAGGVVLYYLVRLQPFSKLHQITQGGNFDLPDRLFHSIGDVWNMCNSSMSEVKELTPEWYTTSLFLKNIHNYKFGTCQDGKIINDVELPPWANNKPEEFLRIHRRALESEYVSNHINEWIDLIFGYQQRGSDALAANNVFYYLTYSGLVDLDSIDDLSLRLAMEQQIAHFGQCPQQLFHSPHPLRGNGIRCYPHEHFSILTKSFHGNISLKSLTILSDRLIGINKLGIIELHYWKLEKENEKLKLKIQRDTSPYDIIPRIPIYSNNILPIATSKDGRIFISGGSPTGIIHIRLIDFENGHVLARASIYGHDEIVTCLSMDSLKDQEFFISGSKDCTIMLWQISQINNPFRPPRISSCPLTIYRGHTTCILACKLNIEMGIIISISENICLIHNLHTGAICFGFNAPPYSIFQHVGISIKGYVISCAKMNDTSIINIYNMIGELIRQEAIEFCNGIELSQDGTILMTNLSRSLRWYQLDDFTIVQEFSNPKNHPCPISTCIVGPHEAVMLAVTGHIDGSLVWHVLPDADRRISMLGSVGRFLNLNSKLKVMKGTVQQAQKLAITTMDNAQIVSNTAKDIATEAKSMMQNIFGLFK